MNVIETLEGNLVKLSGLGAVVRFDLGKDGAWVVDARTKRPSLEQDDESEAEPACSIRITAENLEKLLSGRLDPMLGYTMGKIKIQGSMGVAMKLVAAIG